MGSLGRGVYPIHPYGGYYGYCSYQYYAYAPSLPNLWNIRITKGAGFVGPGLHSNCTRQFLYRVGAVFFWQPNASALPLVKFDRSKRELWGFESGGFGSSCCQWLALHTATPSVFWGAPNPFPNYATPIDKRFSETTIPF